MRVHNQIKRDATVLCAQESVFFCQRFIVAVYLIRRSAVWRNRRLAQNAHLPLALAPTPLWNGWQAGHTEMIGLQVLRRSPGHDPNQLLGVWPVAFTRAVLGHALCHAFSPVEEFSIIDL